MGNVTELKTQTVADFEAFWKECPKRVDKALAKAKWDKITGEGLKTRMLDRDSGMFVEIELKATPEELIAGMKRYYRTQFDRATYKIRDDGKYTMHPATWLNRGRWMDD